MTKQNFKDIIGLAAPYKGAIAANFLLNILNAVLSLFTFLAVVPFLYILFNVQNASPTKSSSSFWNTLETFLREYIAVHGQMSALVFLCVFIAVITLAKNTVNYGALLGIARIRTSVSRDLRGTLYDKVLRLPLSYYTGEKKGDLISRMTNDLMEIEFSVIGALEGLTKSPIMIIIYLGALIYTSWHLTLFALIFLPISGWLISRVAKSLKNAAGKGKDSLGELISVIEETLSGMRVVKVFNAEGQFQHKFHSENRRFFGLMHKLYKREYLSSPLIEFISLLVITTLLYFGGGLVLEGELSGAVLIGYLVVFSQIIPPARGLSDAVFRVSKGAASLERVKEIMDGFESIQDGPSAQKISGFKDNITFENVSFSYVDRAVLKGMNFTINKGETIALVGPSGGGKSTVASLLVRLLDPQHGSIKIDGVDLRELELKSWRDLVGVVTQDSVLFNDTVLGNIALGQDSPDPDRAWKAAEIGNALDFIQSNPEGLQFNVGDGGNKLSGGQKQRLCIARAVYKNPPVLILDEATSALDTQSEQAVQYAIDNMMQNRTSLVIAHRLSTVQRANRILVIENGEIVQQGNHESLMKQEGLYKTLVELQEL